MPHRRIVYIQYTNPGAYPPLEHSSRILADAAWEVLFLGTGAFQEANNLRSGCYPHITERQLRFPKAGWRQKLHYLWFCTWCLAWAIWWRPQWVYASDLLACPPALLLSSLLRLRILYHEHDSPGRATSIFIRFCMKARQSCARRASMCILPNQQRARRFVADTQAKSPVQVVWNCPELRELSAGRNGKPADGLKVLYHGSISPVGLPLTILEALAVLPEDVTLTVVGYETLGSQGYIEALLARAEELGIRSRIHCLGPLNRVDLLKTCAACHVGLALFPLNHSDFNLRALTGASNKPFDYLACELAVLVSDLPDWREMFVDSGYGLSCNPEQPASIAAALRQLYDRPADRRLMGERGRKRVLAEWNYETQFEPVLRKLGTA
jgi:glycosyltransferase involved in cell wall biosynthesis